MRIMGIDPGVGGALAFFDTLTGRRVVGDMPTQPMGKDGKKRQISGALLREWIERHAPINHAFLELVTGMPKGGEGGAKMGSTSAFNFGGSFHGVRIALEYAGIPYTLVVPRVWKRTCGLVGSEKEGSRLRAMQLFPDMAPGLSRKMDADRAEALLIAYHGSVELDRANAPDPFEEPQR